MSVDDWLTTGDYVTEAVAVDTLLAAIGDRWFRPYREVEGHYLFTRPHTEDRQPRADLILRPTGEAVAAGWSLGVIGVEAKRSGVHLGPLVAQVLDYQGAVFYPDGGTGVVPLLWALWPAGQVAGPMASVLAQRRIATASIATTRGLRVRLKVGGRNVLSVGADGMVVGSLVAGRKRGSR